MNYRKATPEDLNYLSELFDAYRKFYGKVTDLEGAKTFLKNRISNAESEIYVSENSAAKLVGFVQLYPLFLRHE